MSDSSAIPIVIFVVEVFVACVLNLIIPICFYACSLMQLKRLFCLTYQTQLALQHGGVHAVTTDTEFSDVTAHYL